jgi:DNA polymerase delta subunit 1
MSKRKREEGEESDYSEPDIDYDIINELFEEEQEQPEEYEEKKIDIKLSCSRPPIKNEDIISMQLLDIDSYVDYKKQVPIIRLYGVNMNENSIQVNVHNFFPYFYISYPDFKLQDLPSFVSILDGILLKQTKKQGIRKIILVEKQNIYGYSNQKKPFLQIFVSFPFHVTTLRKVLESGIFIKGKKTIFQTFESNLPFILRFMCDKNIIGGGWLVVKKYKTSSSSSLCQLEIDVDEKDLIIHQPEGEWEKIAPIRIISFDIECESKSGGFPKPENDPVIQISTILSINASNIKFRSIHTLKSCAPIEKAHVYSYEKEEDMLMSWKKLILELDPDFLTGYNILNFDIPYLFDRAKTLGLQDFPYLGRLSSTLSTCKDSQFNSRAFGRQANKQVTIHGRIIFDLLPIIRREGHKLRSYSLNAVSSHFLKLQKDDVHHREIPILQNGDENTRKRLALYCIKDAALVLQLMEKLMLLINFIEMARVVGVPISYLITRGQAIKVLSQLYRKANPSNYIIPVFPTTTEQSFDGATVLNPKTGFYNHPIATLDFASLYPSIMMRWNLCYTSYIKEEDTKKFQPYEYIQTPHGDFFLTKEKHEGLLPQLLSALLDARSKAKKLMKNEKDPFKTAVYNGRQLALKISANSIYGYNLCD